MSERHHRKSPQRRRAHERFDKTLLRLPAPFYRRPDGTIDAGPAGARVVFIVSPKFDLNIGGHGEHATISVGYKLVRGWRVTRANAQAIGYYVQKDTQGFASLERHGDLPDGDEGITWARAWDNEEAQRALLAVAALG